jgi:nucleoid DNA-binding protein
MTKAEIARRVSWKTQLSIPQCLKIIDCILESISASVADGHRVHFRKFGSFYPREKAERIGRNPKTGEPVVITARTIPCFKPSAELKSAVNK